MQAPVVTRTARRLTALVAAALVVPASMAAARSPRPLATAPPVPPPAMTEPAPVRYEPVDYAALRRWADDDHLAALKAFQKSCGPVIAAARSGVFQGRSAPPPGLLSACDDAQRLEGKKVSRLDARAFFENHFQPHRVRHAAAEGLLTGYYEPLIKGSRTPTAQFATPLYRRPPELVNLVDDSQRGAAGLALTHARKTSSGAIEPFATRRLIDEGHLAGRSLELIYLADPVEVFFLQIQGSGRVRLTDGTTIRVTYDGKNGHPYTSIGRYLIDKGIIPADRMSLDALARWLRTDTTRARDVMWQNASYVFFREMTGAEAGSPVGVLKIPLTPGRSLAVDAGVHPIGTPVWVDAPQLVDALHAGTFQRLMIAQDVGSAIRGPERGDIYFGSGHAAGKLAGVTKHPGNLIVLLPREGPAPRSLETARRAP